MQGLCRGGEPQYPPVNSDRKIRQQGVCKRVLAHQRGAVHIHHQAHQKRDTDPHFMRLVDAPENQRERNEIRHPTPSAPRKEIEEK